MIYRPPHHKASNENGKWVEYNEEPILIGYAIFICVVVGITMIAGIIYLLINRLN